MQTENSKIQDPLENPFTQIELKDSICLSGGALGADCQFGMNAGFAGHQVIHWSFNGHKSPAPEAEIIRLSQEQLNVADSYLFRANASLKRWVPTQKPWIANLLRRNLYQIQWSNSIYAVSSWERNGIVKGGTSWAVQMYIDRFLIDHTPMEEANLYFFDQTDAQWWKWQETWSKIESPQKPTKIYAGIGTRELTEAGKNAIRSLYTNSPYPLITGVPKVGDVIYVPDFKIEGKGLDNSIGGWIVVNRVLTVSDDIHYVCVAGINSSTDMPWEKFLKELQIPLRIQFGLNQAHYKPDYTSKNNTKMEYYRVGR
jgi:hypothetical protein